MICHGNLKVLYYNIVTNASNTHYKISVLYAGASKYMIYYVMVHTYIISIIIIIILNQSRQCERPINPNGKFVDCSSDILLGELCVVCSIKS